MDIETRIQVKTQHFNKRKLVPPEVYMHASTYSHLDTCQYIQTGQEHCGALRAKKTKTQERGGPGLDEEDWDRRTRRINGLEPGGPEGPGKQTYLSILSFNI